MVIRARVKVMVVEKSCGKTRCGGNPQPTLEPIVLSAVCVIGVEAGLIVGGDFGM